MRNKRFNGFFLTSLLTTVLTLGLGEFPSASAVGITPKVQWDCSLMRLQDDQGDFVFFDPRARVTWYGKKLSYKVLYWASKDTRLSQAGQTYGTVTANRSGWNQSNLDVSHKFYYYENTTEYKKIVLTVTTETGKKSSQSCIWDGPVANGW